MTNLWSCLCVIDSLIMCCAVLCCALLCSAVLCCAVLCRAVLAESDLSGIDCITTEQPFLALSLSRIRAITSTALLSRALPQLNQSELAAALQVSFHLGPAELVSSVRECVSEVRGKVVSLVRSTLGMTPSPLCSSALCYVVMCGI